MVDLSQTARSLVAPGKGILAADESTKSADARLASYGIPVGEESRRAFRDLFLATPGIEDYLTGVILYEETLGQDSLDGVPFPKLLSDRGIQPGIKVDTGTEPMEGSEHEVITGGLLGLSERLTGYVREHHTTFTKWRAVVRIDGDRLPTAQALSENAKRLARYAHDVQLAGMVPMIEPEVLLEGSHSLMRSRDVLTKTLSTVMDALQEQAVDLSGIILKTSMALSGASSGRVDSPSEVAEATMLALTATVPSVVPGVVFLSGGQSPDQATDNLAAITKRAHAEGAPWPLTFSYSRALQEEALTIWKGNPEHISAARNAFTERLKRVQDAVAA